MNSIVNILRKTTNRQSLLMAVPAVLLFVYVFVRAKYLSLTWDEAYTFFEFVRHPSWLPHDFNYMSANNHLLNTWLMKCSVFLFGESEIALRLPNVLAGGIFFFYSFRLLQKLFPNRWIAFTGFLVLALNPYLLDFFSIARGYGISLAFLAASLYELTVYLKEDSSLKRAIRIQILIVLALLANLTLLHVLAAVTLVLLADQFLQKENPNRKKNLFILAELPLLTVAVLFFYLRKLEQSGAFFFGKEISSPAGTVHSLAHAASYRHAFIGQLLFWIWIIVPFVLLILLLRKGFFRNEFHSRWPLMILLILLIGFSGPVVQHYLLGSNFLSGRTGIFLIVLSSLVFFGMLLQLPQRIANGILLLFAAGSVSLFAISFNLHYTIDFRDQADVKTMMQDLKKENPPLHPDCFANIIATDLPWELPVNYYRMRFNMQNFGHAGRKLSVPACSWYYLSNTDSLNAVSDIEILTRYPNSKTVLFRKKNPEALCYLMETWKDFEVDDPYAELLRDTFFIGEQGTFAGGEHPYSISSPIHIPDSLKGKFTAATVNCRMYYHTRNTPALFTFAVTNSTGDQFHTMYLSELSVPPGEWSITGWTIPLPADTKSFKVFLQNSGETPVYMDNVALRLLGRK